jgi:phosphatidylglycerol:prolipoprotein diacylglycerol transferase
MFTSPGAVAIEIGPLSIHWYGILIATGFLLALYICTKIARDRGENPEVFIDLASVVLVAALIGARLYYVVFNWEYYSQNPADIVKIWQGGLAIHGGMIGGLVAGYAFTKIKNLSFLRYCDIVSVGLILGQAIGRWGNFFNSEAFGGPTQLPWKLYIPLQNRPAGLEQFEFFHPTFLYESLWNFLIFGILFFYVRKRYNHVDGATFMAYLILYSTGRLFIESLRTDSLYFFGEFRAAQVASLILIIIGIAGFDYLLRKQKNTNKDEVSAESSIE